MPDARLQRTRENYPEGVDQFGVKRWLELTKGLDKSVSQSEVPRPPLAATEPPAEQPSTDPQAVEYDELGLRAVIAADIGAIYDPFKQAWLLSTGRFIYRHGNVWIG